MFQTISFFVLLAFSSALNSTSEEKTPAEPKKTDFNCAITGALIASDKKQHLGGYAVYFNGYSTQTDSNGRFQLPTNIDFTTKPLFLLVSSGVKWDACPKNSKTIAKAVQDEKLPYKFYAISWEKNPQGEMSMCFGVEDLKQYNYEVPIQETLIIPINGFFVKELRSAKTISNQGILQLPKIVLEAEKPLQESKSNFLLAQNCPPEVHDYKVENLSNRGKAKGLLRFPEWEQFHERVIKMCQNTINLQRQKVDIVQFAKA